MFLFFFRSNSCMTPGPAGLAAAIKLKQLANASSNPDFRVLLLEKGSEIGSHIVSGNVLEPGMLTELFPDWNAPENPSRFQLATPVDPSKEILRFLTKTSALSLPVPPQMRNDGNFIISLSRLCNWLGERAEELGVEIYPGFSGSELLYTSEGSVRGVRTNDLGLGRDGKPTEAYQPGMDFEAPVTLLAEGCHGSLSKQAIGRFDLRKNSQPQTYGLGLKEIWEIEPEKFKQGTVVHSVGYPLNSNTYGGGFIYHFGENLASVGLVVGLDYQNPWTNPYNEFQKMKHHPLFAETLTGGSCLEYAARALVEGGFQSIPKCAFPGGALIGDSAGFVNLPKIKGTHNAIRSGILAAETCFDAINSSSKNGSQISLDAYDQMLRASPTWDELRRVRNYRPSFSSRLGLYGGLMYSGLEEYILRGKAPWTFKHHADYAVTKPADQCPQIEYPKPDGKLSFDIMTSVSRTGTIHEENEPVHLQVEDWDRHTSSNWPRFKGLEQRFCPAGVYEYVEDESKKEGVRFQINAQK